MTNPFIDKCLLRLHYLIRKKGTGSPKMLAKKLDCSERTARSKIEQLKDAGLPIAYSRDRQTYFYTEEVALNASLILGDKEMHKIVGGCGRRVVLRWDKNIFPTAEFLPRTMGALLCDSRNTNRKTHLTPE